MPVGLANSFTVQRLSLSMQCSFTAIGMSVWTDTEHPLWCILEAHLNDPNLLHQPWSTSLHTALHGTPMHFYREGTLFPYINTVPIYILPPQDNIMNAMICVHIPVNILLSDGDIYKFMPHAFMHLQSTFHVTILLAKSTYLPWLME